MNTHDLLHRAIEAEEKLAEANRKLKVAKEALEKIHQHSGDGFASRIAEQALATINSTKGVMRE